MLLIIFKIKFYQWNYIFEFGFYGCCPAKCCSFICLWSASFPMKIILQYNPNLKIFSLLKLFVIFLNRNMHVICSVHHIDIYLFTNQYQGMKPKQLFCWTTTWYGCSTIVKMITIIPQPRAAQRKIYWMHGRWTVWIGS
jgi:hypothetical protein